jgi:hypothetical protein
VMARALQPVRVGTSRSVDSGGEMLVLFHRARSHERWRELVVLEADGEVIACYPAAPAANDSTICAP